MRKLTKYYDLQQCVAGCMVGDWCRKDVRNVGYVGCGQATDVTVTLDGCLPDSHEDRRTLDFPSNLTVLRW